MATSVPMAANEHHHHQPQQEHDQHHPPTRRSSGRRRPKSGGDGPKKRTPQRGMGVEKLERLRLQERWKKMTEIDGPNQVDLMNNAAHVPVQVAKLAGFAGPNRNRSPNPGYNLGFGHGQVGLVSDHHLLQTDLYGNGCLSNSGFRSKSVSGVSKELSSTPNAVKSYVSEHCNACHKKIKKLIDGESLGGGGGRMMRQSDMYAQMYDVGECGFMGLSVGDNRTVIKQENQELGISAASHVGYPVENGKQGIEVVAAHRKLGGSFGSEGGVLMEYEFFPPVSRIKDEDDDLVMMNPPHKVTSQTSSAMAGFDAAAAAASNKCIDLSLKLSY